MTDISSLEIDFEGSWDFGERNKRQCDTGSGEKIRDKRRTGITSLPWGALYSQSLTGTLIFNACVFPPVHTS